MSGSSSTNGDDPVLSVEVVDPEEPLARQALRAYIDDVASRWYKRPATAEEIETALLEHPSRDLRPPEGLFLIVRQGTSVLGCGGLRMLSAGVGEIKRVHVSLSARGQGLGRRVMLELEELARNRDVHTLRLDTRTDLIEARALYASLGYLDVPAFNGGPYAQHWLSKSLACSSP